MNKKEHEQLYSNAGNVCKAFMEAWLYQDYDQMYTLVNKAWGSKHTRDFLWEKYSAIIIDEYEITREPAQPTAAMVQAEVRIMYNGQWLKPENINLVCETKAYAPSLHGEWGVNPPSTLKLIQRPKTRAERREEERNSKK